MFLNYFSVYHCLINVYFERYITSCLGKQKIFLSYGTIVNDSRKIVYILFNMFVKKKLLVKSFFYFEFF